LLRYETTISPRKIRGQRPHGFLSRNRAERQAISATPPGWPQTADGFERKGWRMARNLQSGRFGRATRINRARFARARPEGEGWLTGCLMPIGGRCLRVQVAVGGDHAGKTCKAVVRTRARRLMGKFSAPQNETGPTPRFGLRRADRLWERVSPTWRRILQPASDIGIVK